MQENESVLWGIVLDMAIASYMHPQPKADEQVRRMAKRFMKSLPTKEKVARRTLRRVVKTTQPALLVQIAYEELISE